MGVFGLKPDIKKLETSQDIDGLIEALQYPEVDVRLEAAQALSNFGSADACPALLMSLKDGDKRVQEASINALVAIGETALPLLFNAMGDESWLVRYGATQALTRLRWSPDDDEIKVCFLFAQGAWEELSEFKKKAIPYLIEGLRDENEGVRKGAAIALGTIGDPDGFEPLTRAITDPETEVRVLAARALGELSDPRAIPFLVNLFYDSTPGVRNAAADALSVIGMPAFEPLIAALNDTKTIARLAAIRALGKIPDPGVIPPLISKLNDAFPETRTSAAAALGEIGEPALPMIMEVMKNGSRIARLACLDAFAKSIDPKVTEVLVAATKGVDEQIAKKAEGILRKREGLKVWQTAIDEDMETPCISSTAEIWNTRQDRKALEQLGAQETDKIIAILRDPDQDSRLRAILKRVNEDRPVMEALIMLLKSKDDEIKRRAVEAIDRLEDVSGSPLMVVLNDNDPFVRTVAARNLGKLGWMNAFMPLLRHSCEDKDKFVNGTAAEAITLMGTQPLLKRPVADLLINALTDDSTKVRVKAAELLGNLGTTIAIPTLISLFRDRDQLVQTSAAEALAEIGKPAFGLLAQAAHDPDTRTRCGALTALAEFGKKGEEYLNEGLTDSNPDVRAHVKKIFTILKHEKDTVVAPRAGMAGIPRKSPAQLTIPPTDATVALPGEKPGTDPGTYISQFASRDKKARAHAIQSLAAMGEPAFRPLVFAAHHPDKAMRIGALKALSHFGTMGAPYIVKALEDTDLDVQHSAYRILNHLDGKFGLPRVGGKKLMAGVPTGPGAPSVPLPARERTNKQTGKLYPTDIIPRLADSNEQVRTRAIRVLAEMGEPAFLPLVYAAYNPEKEMRIGALQALAEFGTMGTPYIVKALEDADLDVQHAVYQILKEQDGRNGLPRVGGTALNAVTQVTSGEPAAHSPAAETEQVNPDEIQDPEVLAGMLDHADKNVQMKAAIALAMMGSAAVPALINAFTSGSKEILATAAEIISSFGPDAVEPLINALGNPNSSVVAGAASVLGKLGDHRAVPALVLILERNDRTTGLVAAEALGYLGDTKSVEALIRALNGTDSELQGGAARALGYIGDERAVTSLIEAMGSEDFSLRRIAIDALVGIGKASIPYLSQALQHSRREVRSGAAECFMQMGDLPESERDQIYLLAANEEWLEITKRGEPAVDVLIHFADDDSGEVRAGVATALGKIGGLRAIGTLTGILADNNTLVRKKAMNSLSEMGESVVAPALRKLRLTTASAVQQQAIDQILERLDRNTHTDKTCK